MMKEEYAALKEFFAPDVKRGRKVKDVVVEQATEQVPEQVPEQTHRIIANTKIRIIKRETPSVQEENQEKEQVQEEIQRPVASSKDLKAWQKEQEQKKLAELSAKGIKSESLLTVESVKRWIEDEQRTFAYVAREYLGMPESKVADFAREHGIKSTISKKRAILAAKNRALH
jgi:hypothetical protein